MWKLPGDKVDEAHYETVGEGNRSKEKGGGKGVSPTQSSV